MENYIHDKNYNYNILSKYTCIQNIDRIKFFLNENNPLINAVSAGYHLNKETQIKTGGLFFFNINDEGKINILEEKTILLNYGILDIKFNDNYTKIFSSNSDYSYSIFDFENKKENKFILDEENYEKNKLISNDLIELYKDNNKCLFGTNDGFTFYEDLNKNKTISKIKSHEYGLWSIYIINENLYLTGSEDCLLKLWDIRENNQCISINKSHNSSINSIIKLDFNENILLTGSYDEKINFIDLRQFKSEIKKINTYHMIWDMRQEKLKDKNLIFMACSYEGFNIWDFNQQFEMNHLLRLPVTEKENKFHKTIVYGIDIKKKKNEEKINILSCSFYDNLIMYWDFF